VTKGDNGEVRRGTAAAWLLSTPKALAEVEEFAADEAKMLAIRAVTTRFAEAGVHNGAYPLPDDDKPLGGCDASLVPAGTDGHGRRTSCLAEPPHQQQRVESPIRRRP